MLALMGLMAAFSTAPARAMKKMKGVSAHTSQGTYLIHTHIIADIRNYALHVSGIIHDALYGTMYIHTVCTYIEFIRSVCICTVCVYIHTYVQCVYMYSVCICTVCVYVQCVHMYSVCICTVCVQIRSFCSLVFVIIFVNMAINIAAPVRGYEG